MQAPEDDDEVSYLTLGDADFSYSLDLARYLCWCNLDARSSQSQGDYGGFVNDRKCRITATGFDSLQSLGRKYRDVDSILRKLRAVPASSAPLASGRNSYTKEKASDHHERKKRKECSSIASRVSTRKDGGRAETGNLCVEEDHGSCTSSSKNTLSVSIYHNVNAVVFPSDTPVSTRGGKATEEPNYPCPSDEQCELTKSSIPSSRHRHVIFNHPHLGTEDAKLHSMFLSHLFYSARARWLCSPGGLLHLTLVLGQCERWHALTLAKHQNLKLLRRVPFQPPPPPRGDDGERCYYQRRRHQSGKSFARRTDGSETLVFGRYEDEEWLATMEERRGWNYLLPWYENRAEDNAGKETDIVSAGANVSAESLAPAPAPAPFKCPECDKSFEEERSRKKHIKSVHSGPSNGGSRKIEPIYCKYCNSEAGHSRAFCTADALSDHIKAKHTGPHTDIKPDWQLSSGSDKKSSTLADVLRCKDGAVCGQRMTGGSNECCEICGVRYTQFFTQDKHEMQFQAEQDRFFSGNEKFPYECPKCLKGFWELRALFQHENFCSSKTETEDCCHS